jgi:ABC-type sugar transport system substrate-binding protein
LRPAAWILAASFSLALAACGGGGGAGGAGESPKPGAAPGKPVIGAILMQQDQFFLMNEQGMTAAAIRLGADLRVQNAAGALDKEASILDTFMAQKVQAVLVSPLSSKASFTSLRAVYDRGIQVVTYNNAIDADFPACSITSDQQSLGSSSGKAARAYIEGHLGGVARVALIGFASQLPEQGGARQRGFKAEIQSLPNVVIVAEQDAWNAPEAATAVGEILAKKPDVIWAANEGGTVGAVTAVRNAGKAGQVAVFGTDVSAQLVDFLLADDGILQAVTAQKPFDMGQAALEAAVKVIKGETVEKRVVLPGILFSRDKPDELRALKATLSAAPH